MRIILAAAFSAAFIQPAFSAPVTDFLALYSEPLGRTSTEPEIVGAQRGLIAANAYLTGIRREAPMYCQPESLNLTPDQLVEMLRRGVKEQPDLAEAELAPALLAVLQHTFPCAPRSR